MEKLDVAIIGAGSSGIYCAQKLSNGKKVAIFERCPRPGGRTASRNVGGHIFNFGVNSFHTTAHELSEMAERGVEDDTLIRDNVEVKGNSSVNGWIDQLVKNLDLRLNHKVIKIETGVNENILYFEGQDPVAAKDIILAAPAPQALELLTASGIKAPQLGKVKYRGAIFYMIAMGRELEHIAEFDVLQYLSQEWRGAVRHYYLLLFQGDWSDKSSSELREEFDEVFQPIESYVQKWRCGKAQNFISSDVQMLLKNKSIYLAGDYFFGNDADSSTLSAQGVLEEVFNAQ